MRCRMDTEGNLVRSEHLRLLQKVSFMILEAAESTSWTGTTGFVVCLSAIGAYFCVSAVSQTEALAA